MAFLKVVSQFGTPWVPNLALRKNLIVEFTMTKESYPTHHAYLTDLFLKLGNNFCKFYGVLKNLGCQIRQPHPIRRQIPEKKVHRRIYQMIVMKHEE